MTTQTQCTYLQNALNSLKLELVQTAKVIETYAQNQSRDIYDECKNKLAAMRKERERLLEEYGEKVKELLSTWNGAEDMESFLKHITVDNLGRVIVKSDISVKQTVPYFPSIIRVVRGKLDLSHLITNIDNLEYIEGSLISSNWTDFSALRLKRTSELWLPYAKKIIVPQLEVCGNATMQSIEEGDFSSLRKVRWLEIKLSSQQNPHLTINFPSLIEADKFEINTTDARPQCTLVAPQLEHIRGYLKLDPVRNIELPRLKTIDGNFESVYAISINLPVLTEIGGKVNLRRYNGAFRKAFPVLYKVGHEDQYLRNRLLSFDFYITAPHLKDQVEAEKTAGSLMYEGEVDVRD